MGRLHNFVSAVLWRLCRLLPIDRKKVVFCSYYGRGYSDSPKAIAEALLATGADVNLQWLVKCPEEGASLPSRIRPVPYTGLSRIYALSTARVWVDNCRKYDRYKRPGQFYLQTWHGFALKRIEKDAAANLEPDYIRGCQQDSAMCDLMVSGSAFMTGLYQNSFWYNGAVAAFGTPRNDAFFHPDPAQDQDLRDFFGLPHDRKLLLYAPTFRSDGGVDAYGLDIQSALNACEARFGGRWSALIRLHPNAASLSRELFPYDGSRILDATGYPDMQVLLSTVQLLITDYSSSMFDYALQDKPCIQFATDIAAYQNDRNFYFPLDGLPFPLAESNDALCQIIRDYDPAPYRLRWKAFQAEQGFCEDGQAAARCAQWILARMK